MKTISVLGKLPQFTENTTHVVTLRNQHRINAIKTQRHFSLADVVL
jgi:hypothetical protein